MINTEPPIPRARPRALKTVNCSFSTHKANTVTSRGVTRVSKEAWIVEVRVNPLINSIWLIATPARAHQKKRVQSLRRILADELPGIQAPQNNTRLIPTLNRLTAKGPTNEGEILLTKL